MTDKIFAWIDTKQENYVRTFFLKLFLFAITGLFLLITGSVSAHNLPIGGSRWSFGKNTIIGNIDLGSALLQEIKEIKEAHLDLDSLPDEQLQIVATDILQPYINKKLSIAVAGKAYPVKVNKVGRSDNMYTVWLSVDNIRFDNPDGPVKINYTLLFEETGNAHVNLAYGYLSDATGAELQKVFDFSPPPMQTTFDHNAPVWEFSVKGVAQPVVAPKSEDNVVNVKADSVGQNSSVVALQTGDKTRMPNAGAKKISRPYTMAVPVGPNTEKDTSVSAVAANTPAARSLWANIGEFIALG